MRDDAVEELHFCLLFAFYSFTVEWDEKKSPQNCYGNPNHRSDGVIVCMDEDQSGLGEVCTREEEEKGISLDVVATRRFAMQVVMNVEERLGTEEKKISSLLVR